jgi:hypothetical protein
MQPRRAVGSCALPARPWLCGGLLVLAVHAACAGTDPGRRGPRPGAEQVLAREFGPEALQRTARSWRRLGRGVAEELAQWPGPDPVVHDRPSLTATELGRATTVATRTRAMVAAELARRPQPALAPLRSPLAVARDLTAGLVAIPRLLGFWHRPMPERDDRSRRIDPHDDTPEATVWRRLARRLGLR